MSYAKQFNYCLLTSPIRSKTITVLTKHRANIGVDTWVIACSITLSITVGYRASLLRRLASLFLLSAQDTIYKFSLGFVL